MRSDGRDELTRRRVLGTATLALVGVMAGCSDGGSSPGTATPAPTTDRNGESAGTAAPPGGDGTATDSTTPTATPEPGPQIALQFDPGEDRRSVRIFHGGGATITPDNTARIVLSTDGSVTYPTDGVAADGTVEGSVTTGDEIAAVEGIPETGTVFVFWKGPDGAEKLLGRWQQEG